MYFSFPTKLPQLSVITEVLLISMPNLSQLNFFQKHFLLYGLGVALLSFDFFC